MRFKDLQIVAVKSIHKAYEKYLTPLSDTDKKRYTGYFYILLTLGALAFFGLFAISPTFNTITNLNKQYKDNKIVLNSLNRKVANLKSLDADYSLIQANIEQIYAAIPKNTEIPKLTRQLENLAAENNLQVTGISFNSIEIYPNSKNDPIFSYLFSVNVSGESSDINAFIRDVIGFDRIVGIERISTGTDQENKSTLSFTGRAFFAPK